MHFQMQEDYMLKMGFLCVILAIMYEMSGGETLINCKLASEED